MVKRVATRVLKRPAAKVCVLKRPAVVATKVKSSCRGSGRPGTLRAKMSPATRILLKKVDLVEAEIEDEGSVLLSQVQELERLYRDAAEVTLLSACDQFNILEVAVRLATDCGEFLGEGLMRAILEDMHDEYLNLLNRSGRNILLKDCEGPSDASGTLTNWEPICLLAAHPRFACLDLLPDCHTMYINGDCRSCLDDHVLLELIQRNRASSNCKIRGTVNHISCTWGEEQTLLQLVCGARSDSLAKTDYSNIEQLVEEARATQNFEVLHPKNLPRIHHLQGSPAIAKALLEHPDFKATNHRGNGGFTALGILLSTSDGVAGAPEGTKSRGVGYLSHRHLPWDAKVAALNVFLAHAESHPDQVDFKLRNEPGRYGERECWLPAELARQAGFPADVTRRLEAITLSGLPSRILRVPQVVKSILEFI